MKKVFSSLIFLLFVSSFHSLFALDIESTPKVSSASDTSISVDWEDVDGALGYYIYYSEQSGVEDGYEFEGIDLIETSETVIDNLKKDTDYYVAVTVVDDNGNESQYSPEAVFSSSEKSSPSVVTSAFALEEVIVVSSNQLELTFNAIVDQSEEAVREFKLTEKDSSTTEVFVSETDLDGSNPTKLIITTESNLKEETQYELTIVSMQDIDGNNIESGIDGIANFTVPRGSTTSFEETESAPVQIVDLEEENIELNAALSQEESKGGTLLSDDEVLQTAESTAKDNDTLPQTGPETVLLLLLAIMLGGGLFFFHARKA